MSITDVEQQILDEIDDAYDATDSNVGDVWHDDTAIAEVRKAISDGIDEACMHGEFFVQNLVVPLVEDCAFYSISPNRFYPYYLTRLRFVDEDRDLECVTFRWLYQRDSMFMLSSGTPFHYVPISTDLFYIWPRPSSSAGVLNATVVGTPQAYTDDARYLTVREELEQALVAYGRYHLFMRAGGRFKMALEAYAEYAQLIGATQLFKHVQKQLRELRYKSYAES